MRPRQITAFGWSAADDLRAERIAAERGDFRGCSATMIVLDDVGPDGEEDVMAQAWHCLACARRFRWGQARMERGAIRCPECGDADLARGDGHVVRAL